MVFRMVHWTRNSLKARLYVTLSYLNFHDAVCSGPFVSFSMNWLEALIIGRYVGRYERSLAEVDLLMWHVCRN